MRSMREKNAAAEPTIGETFGIKDPSDWRLNAPKASQFYMTSGTNGGLAHKPAANFKAGPNQDRPPVFMVHTACEPEGGNYIVSLANGVNGYPEPYTGDLKCEFCAKGTKMPAVPETPRGTGRRVSRPRPSSKSTPPAYSWPTYKPEDPMAPVTEFFKTLYEAETPAKAVISDELRGRAVIGLLKVFGFPEDKIPANLIDEERPVRRRAGKPKKPVAQTAIEPTAEAATVEQPEAEAPTEQAEPQPSTEAETQPEAQAEPEGEAPAAEEQPEAQPETSATEDEESQSESEGEPISA